MPLLQSMVGLIDERGLKQRLQMSDPGRGAGEEGALKGRKVGSWGWAEQEWGEVCTGLSGQCGLCEHRRVHPPQTPLATYLGVRGKHLVVTGHFTPLLLVTSGHFANMDTAILKEGIQKCSQQIC